MKYNYSTFVFRSIIFLAVISIFYKGMMRFGYLPLLTNSMSFDAKIYDLQNRNVKEVDVMALGSSITLDNINSAVLTKNIPLSYYNFSSWGLEISDINSILDTYLPKYQPKYLIICSSITDFRKAGNAESYNKYLTTGNFIKNNLNEWFYIKNYNPILDIATRKKEYAEAKSGLLKFDNYGGISRTLIKSDTIMSNWVSNFNFPTEYTDMQYREMARFARRLKQQHIQLIFIQSPIQLAYLHAIKNPAQISSHFETCRWIIEKEGGTYLNYHDPAIFADSLFVDPFHLSGAGAKLLTTHLVKDILPLTTTYTAKL